MKVSLKWLKRYVSIEASPQELSEVFPMLGFEVEEFTTLGLPPLPCVVVGEVKSRQQHPDADRLGICQVQVGPNEDDIKQIVCGASNYKVGDRVPVALIGAVLPGDFKIKKSKLRGVDSEGMMCSPRELGLAADSSGLMILEGQPQIGTPINDLFKDNDVIFDLELTANRGDCLSHIGLARELAAYYNVNLNYPKVPAYELSNITTSNGLLKGLEITSSNAPLYTLWSIKGVKVSPSPDWLKKDLEALGLRSINNIVDITNWIMMDSGQPLHAFDLAKIKGQKLIVRQAHSGEIITTLDEKKRILDESMTVIADEERPLVIAGVMGSLDAEVDSSTVDIVLESAYFNPASIRHTSRKLNMSTDSSYRFVRDVNPVNVVESAQRAVAMILDIAGGELVSPSISLGKQPRTDRKIELDPDFVRIRCGFDTPDEIIADIYKRLGFSVNLTQIPWIVDIPTFRADVERPIDLVEEFLRVHGTSNIPESRVRLEGFSRNDDPIAVFNHKVADYLIGQHFDECCHYSLRQGQEIHTLYGDTLAKHCALDNPLSADHTHFRASLIPGLWDAFKLNQRNANPVERLFETGRVLQVHNDMLSEVLSVAFVIATENPHQRHWLMRLPPDFYKAKNLILEVATIAGISIDNLDFTLINESPSWESNQSATSANLHTDGFQINVGFTNLKLSKEWGLHGPVLSAEILIMPDFLNKKKPQLRFKPFSVFPSSSKDLALVVDTTFPAESARRELQSIATKAVEKKFNLENVSIFDVYQGKGLLPGKKSIAFSITFRADDRTLKDEEIMTAFEQIQQMITSDNRFTIRS